MPGTTTVTVPCRISRSGFSDERIFRITLADGEEYVGGAPREYCFNGRGQPLGPDEPIRGKAIEGRVAAAVVRAGQATTLVSVPDGSVIEVDTGSLQKHAEVPPDVSLQP